ncbi:energy-coupling factor transporter transmembrane component T family protein [Natronobacterium gregoryi]|uniref:ABC-type cobalt transport system, permease component CbiQ n=2 Tax=Natronobacterium gregoryi TaxID=44930 RepID=L0ALI3_NATGS|nr:energy-coupling factor transporter transmembrane component T [Natronobacterium gregoryi]AFZ73915.1 ABC-type cobalt transport system, permease component CbiQ [Natronobacterium gregoryi SP2]ELY71563.1 cobalt transporter [Natronobacterium gregoryi SP2]PLK19058.1 energy-coupling factor transporter transmembrane protein EcfT [Natronobacterium gregoryi SP2]SFJ63133.1 biotin transport system permease protein [Natronobacterium gregoryi]
MLSYEPDDTLAHRLDPRSKLAVQIGFTATALAHTSVPALFALSAVTAGMLAVAGVSLVRTLYAYQFALVILAMAPLVAGATLGSPWFDLSDGLASARASYRVLLILLVSAAYVRSTPVRESRGAIQRTIPGKPGQLLGIGIALVFRFLPVLQADVRSIRQASAARLGTERGVVDRATHLGLSSLDRTFDRADRLSLALQARCFAWNPTLPHLSFTRSDVPVLGLALVLAVTAVL